MLLSWRLIQNRCFILFLISLVSIWALSFQQKAEDISDSDAEITQVDDYLRVVEEGKDAVPKTNTTATRLPVSLQATPASVSIVPAALNESQGNIVLGDALRNVSGVNVMTNFGVHDYFVIRGFDSLTGGLVLTDSAPEPEATFYNLYNIERVEVLKGPGAHAYGGNPLSGSVNLVRKQPIFERFAHVTTSFGSFDSKRGSLDAALANPELGLAFRFNALWQESDGYRDDKANEASGFNPALMWRISERASLNLNLEWASNEYKPDSGIPFLGAELTPVDPETSYQNPLDQSSQDMLRIRLDYNHRVNDVLTLRNRFYHTDLDWKSNGTVFFGILPNQQGRLDLLRGRSELEDRQKFTGNQLEAMLSLSSGSVEHQIIVGLEWVRNDDVFGLGQFADFPIDLLNPVEFGFDPLDIEVAPFTVVDGRSLNTAIYALDRIRFSEQFQLFVGGRLDHIDYEADTMVGSFASVLEREDDEFSPLLGLLYAPNANHSFYANASESFAPPSTLALDQAEPESGRQVEVGSKHLLMNGRLSATFALFNLERENIGIPDQTGVTQQLGDQRSRGLEIELAASLGQGWRVFGAYGYTDSELTRFSEFDFLTGGVADRSGNSAVFVPEHLFNAWVSKEFSNGFGIGLGGRHVGSQFVSEDNLLEIDSYTVFDGLISYNAERWRLAANLKNIGDEEYYTRGLKTPLVGSVIPANPFEVSGAFQVRF